MSRRELGYFLVGLGAGLVLTVAVVIEFAFSFHHMFIVGISWGMGSIVLALPFVMILTGLILLRRNEDDHKTTSDAGFSE